MTFKNKIKILHQEFPSNLSKEERYLKIISFSKYINPYLNEGFKDDHLVQGCQSVTYISSHIDKGNIFFKAKSDALITKGLVGVLLFLFNGETPEKILQFNDALFTELQIFSSLSPNRSNGLSQMILHCKKLSLHLILQNSHQ
ncbi:MAG: SufE family protein [Chlamydiota bacterium]|jgi:cysteine desulfuration protein SufE